MAFLDINFKKSSQISFDFFSDPKKKGVVLLREFQSGDWGYGAAAMIQVQLVTQQKLQTKTGPTIRYYPWAIRMTHDGRDLKFLQPANGRKEPSCFKEKLAAKIPMAKGRKTMFIQEECHWYFLWGSDGVRMAGWLHFGCHTTQAGRSSWEELNTGSKQWIRPMIKVWNVCCAQKNHAKYIYI